MAYTALVNQSPTSWVDYYSKLVTTLVSAGWTIQNSSLAIASQPVVAPYFASVNYWVRLRMPSVGGVTREVIIQRGTLDEEWRMKYSYSQPYTSGTITATRTPTTATSTEDVYLMGGTTDASPAFSSHPTFGTPVIQQVMCGGAAENYTFWCVSYPQGGGTPGTCVILDNLVSGTYPAADIDPFVWSVSWQDPSCCAYITSGINSTTAGPFGTNSKRTWLKKGLGGQAFVDLAACTISVDGTNLVGALPVNPFNSKDDSIPLYWVRSAAYSAPVGWKGVGTMMRGNGTTRVNGDRLTVVTAFDRVVIHGVNLPWNGGSVTL